MKIPWNEKNFVVFVEAVREQLRGPVTQESREINMKHSVTIIILNAAHIYTQSTVNKRRTDSHMQCFHT